MQAHKQRLAQAAKLLERSLSIKLLHQAANEDTMGESLLRGRSAAVAADQGGEEQVYPLESCAELQRLGQVYAAAGDLKEAKRTLRLALQSRHGEVLAARHAKGAVIPGHTRQVAAAGVSIVSISSSVHSS